LDKTFHKTARPERIAFKGDDFAIVPPQSGYALKTEQLKQSLVGALEQGHAQLRVPTKTTHATEPTGRLQGELAVLRKQLRANITLQNGSDKKRLARADIAKFYATSGQTLKLSETKMRRVMDSVATAFGFTAVNTSEAVQAALHAIRKQQPVSFVLAKPGVRVYHYCTATTGVSSTTLPEFRQKLAAVYGNPRGWGRAGIALVHAESGCDYTAWLSAAANVTNFSASICDNYYSCRVGTNVIINYDRWMGATDPWNAAGGALEDYRVMVINHETGHWLGFGHSNCPGPGQPAPVMQQQSISLQGCTFNPWPVAAEIASL
jgi:hypothetical protein